MDALQLKTDTIYDGLGFSTLMLSQREVINSVILISDSPVLVQSLSKYRPELHIIVLTTNKRLARQLDLQWGVTAIYKPATRVPKKSYDNLLLALRKTKYLHKGDEVMIVNTVDGDLHNVLISQEKVG
jgi:pyruvate kinase